MWLKIWYSKWFQWLVSVTLSVILLFFVMRSVKTDIVRIEKYNYQLMTNDTMILSVLTDMVEADKVRDMNYKHLPVVLPIPSINMSKVTSVYGCRIINGDTTFHVGKDFAAKSGTPVVASASGLVVFAKYDNGYGNLIKIDSGNGIVTSYAHLKNIAVSAGQFINQGDEIGTVGSTGNSTGPHLHFQMELFNRNIDPGLFEQL